MRTMRKSAPTLSLLPAGTVLLGTLIGAGLVCSGAGSASLASLAPQKKTQKSRKPAAPAKKPAAMAEGPLPPGRDGEVTAVVRKAVRQIVAGKLDYSLVSPALRSRLTPAKVKSMSSELRAYGPLKSVTFLDRTPKDAVEACTFKVALRDASFIVSASVSKENKLEELAFIEE